MEYVVSYNDTWWLLKKIQLTSSVTLHTVITMSGQHTVFPRNLTTPQNPAALKISPHISANTSQ